MIKSVKIKNFKSIRSAHFELGRINVFIGENGAGKSNILEAIALAAAASANKLDNEFLVSRGIRVTEPEFMHCALQGSQQNENISIELENAEGLGVSYFIQSKNSPYASWEHKKKYHGNISRISLQEFMEVLIEYSKIPEVDPEVNSRLLKRIVDTFRKTADIIEKSNEPFDHKSEERRVIDLVFKSSDADNLANFIIESKNFSSSSLTDLSNFVIFSPENTALRTFQQEGQIEPLGINGEGLLKLLSLMSKSINAPEIEEINQCLKLLGWFDGFKVVRDKQNSVGWIEIHDIYLRTTEKLFDQKSANEGFLFMMFYFALFISNITPNFFAIDNIDASLNPKLCEKLMKKLHLLSIQHKKQAIFTTHNPAVLDGINLDDDDQKLFVISRGRGGNTRIKQVFKPKPIEGASPIRLSEAFLRGSLGGLPRSF